MREDVLVRLKGVQSFRDAGRAGEEPVEILTAGTYRPENGSKLFEGLLESMDAETVVLNVAGGQLSFPRTAVSLVRMVPDLSALDDEPEGIVIESDEVPDE